MHQTLKKLYTVQFGFQSNLFPNLKEEFGFLTQLQQKFVQALEISALDSFIPYIGRRQCRPTQSRMALARAFLAKAIYNMTTTEILIDRLKSDLSLRRLCGYEKLSQPPSTPVKNQSKKQRKNRNHLKNVAAQKKAKLEQKSKQDLRSNH